MRWIDENSGLEVLGTRWIDENSILGSRGRSPGGAGIIKIIVLGSPPRATVEVPRTRWSYENGGLEVLRTRWIDENSTFGHDGLQGGQQWLSQIPPRAHYLMILSIIFSEQKDEDLRTLCTEG